MSYVDKVNISDVIMDLHDARISGIDTSVTDSSQNLITSGAVAQADSNLQTQINNMGTTFDKKGKITINGTEYTVKTSSTDAGEAGCIVFVI